MPLSQEAFVEAQYIERLTIGWEYEPPVPSPSVRLEDAQKLAEMLRAGDPFGAFRNVEADAPSGGGRIAAKTTATAIANGLVAGPIVVITRSWMRKGVHRNVYCGLNGERKHPIDFPVG